MRKTALNTVPEILAGPIVRKASPKQITIWLITKSDRPIRMRLHTKENGSVLFDHLLDENQLKRIQVGTHAFVSLISLQGDKDFPLEELLEYDIRICDESEQEQGLEILIPDLIFPGQTLPSFVIKQSISKVLHGSCRKPHHNSPDGLLKVDEEIQQSLNNAADRPDLLMLSGDQVYADDVAGPTLNAIHQTINLLGLFHEKLEGSIVESSEALLVHPFSYYQRPHLLPDDPSVDKLYGLFFSAKKKPIFTSVNANNHLMTFAEVMAMYILTWSPTMWQQVQVEDSCVSPEFKDTFAKEHKVIEEFADGLWRVRRALAHVPVYMIFDDHDVTDDWNLTRGWEEAIYGNPFAKRIVGNALAGYWLCQGWGNDPDKLEPIYQQGKLHFSHNGISKHDELLEVLFDWSDWHYHLDTTPKIVVLDTRTQRWRSESSLSKPSGLMDWEALCDMQQELINQPSVILVSAAPIFGVKLIETIQKIFTFFGKALTVDAENWMAHKGTASVILNIFRHHKTPPHFVILSGDVHYSFVYDIKLRFRRNSPQITQITCSGIKNEFPEKLLRWFDRLNRVLYARRSPLNWFTQRRNMQIKHRRPDGHKVNTLLNSSGLGKLEIDAECTQIDASVLRVGQDTVKFLRKSHRD